MDYRLAPNLLRIQYGIVYHQQLCQIVSYHTIKVAYDTRIMMRKIIVDLLPKEHYWL